MVVRTASKRVMGMLQGAVGDHVRGYEEVSTRAAEKLRGWCRFLLKEGATFRRDAAWMLLAEGGGLTPRIMDYGRGLTTGIVEYGRGLITGIVEYERGSS